MKTVYGKENRDERVWLQEALTERPGKGIRLRVQPGVFRTNGGRPGQGQYKSWPEVAWTVDCDSVDEALELRDALREFFVAIGNEGTAPVVKRLRQAKKKDAGKDVAREEVA